jgi:hypothetical protein
MLLIKDACLAESRDSLVPKDAGRKIVWLSAAAPRELAVNCPELLGAVGYATAVLVVADQGLEVDALVRKRVGLDLAALCRYSKSGGGPILVVVTRPSGPLSMRYLNRCLFSPWSMIEVSGKRSLDMGLTTVVTWIGASLPVLLLLLLLLIVEDSIRV